MGIHYEKVLDGYNVPNYSSDWCEKKTGKSTAALTGLYAMKNEKRSIRRKADQLIDKNGEIYYKKQNGLELC